MKVLILSAAFFALSAQASQYSCTEVQDPRIGGAVRVITFTELGRVSPPVVGGKRYNEAFVVMVKIASRVVPGREKVLKYFQAVAVHNFDQDYVISAVGSQGFRLEMSFEEMHDTNVFFYDRHGKRQYFQFRCDETKAARI